MSRTWKHKLAVLASLIGMGALGACDPDEALCAKYKQCADEDEDGFESVDDDDDFQAVCVAQLRGLERTLAANEEDECDEVVRTLRALNGCLAGLDCDDVFDDDECEDERDDYHDAIEDADDDCNRGFAL